MSSCCTSKGSLIPINCPPWNLFAKWVYLLRCLSFWLPFATYVHMYVQIHAAPMERCGILEPMRTVLGVKGLGHERGFGPKKDV